MRTFVPEIISRFSSPMATKAAASTPGRAASIIRRLGTSAMRIPRMTTRRWMIAVAVAALVIGLMIGGGILLKQRRDYLLLLAQSHQKEVASSTARGEALKSRFGRTSGMSNEEIMHLHRDYGQMMDRADHHAAMAEKYRQAARYPWLPVEPDPPEP